VEKLKEYLCSRLADWHEPIPQMIASTEIENLMSIPAYDRDPVLPELKDKRIVLLGDALHPMSPFKGQGANQALIDAVETANSLKSFDFPEIRSGLLNSIANRAFKKVIQSRERVTKYHNSEFTSITNFLYPGIDENLINLLK
jgi:2-polyprenyl-6-methoxyphenol hydroxylase-like FAD-dependent oxidoreductase